MFPVFRWVSTSRPVPAREKHETVVDGGPVRQDDSLTNNIKEKERRLKRGYMYQELFLKDMYGKIMWKEWTLTKDLHLNDPVFIEDSQVST